MFGIGFKELQGKKVSREEISAPWGAPPEAASRQWFSVPSVSPQLWNGHYSHLSHWTVIILQWFLCPSPLADIEFRNRWRYITLNMCTQHLVQCLGIQRRVINICWMNEWTHEWRPTPQDGLSAILDWFNNKLALGDDSILRCFHLQYLQGTQIPTLETANLTFKWLMTMYVFIFFNPWLFFFKLKEMPIPVIGLSSKELRK